MLHIAGQHIAEKLQIDVALMSLQVGPVLLLCTVQGALTELLMHGKGGILITPSEPDVVGVHRKGEPFESLDHVVSGPSDSPSIK